MKILVCISKTSDTTSRISFTDNDTTFNTENVQFILNPTDEWYGLVKALELKEECNATITLIMVGDISSEPLIRKGLALGADNAIRIDIEPKSSMDTAEYIFEYAKDQCFDLIITGKETIDYNGSMVGGILAELLSLEYISMATSMTLKGNTAQIEHEIDSGHQTISLDLPFIISCQKGMAEARIPNMRGIMAARTKNITIVNYALVEPKVQLEKFELPSSKVGVKLIDAQNMTELVNLLHLEAKVI